MPKKPQPETPTSKALDTAKIIIGRLPENCEFALSVCNDEAELELYPEDSRAYYHISADYRFAPPEMGQIVMKRGILRVIICPPDLSK